MQSTTERRLSILECLCARRHDTVSNLATEFGVSERTIRNDIVVLSCSYPLYTQQGNGGGVYVLDGFYLGKTFLTCDQEELLRRLSVTLSGEDSKTMDSILRTFGQSTGAGRI